MAEIMISNKMTSRYQLKGYREDSIQFEMMVGNYKNSYMPFEIRAKAKKKDRLPFDLEVMYGGISTLGFEIIPRIINNMEFEIEVAPHNRMTSMYQLIEPPVKKWDSNPVQDSYVLTESPFSAINYGGNSSLVVGNSSRGNGIPYVQFDLSTLEKEIRIKTAKFRLYYNDFSITNMDLYRVNEEWREYNITYLNSPQNKTFITNEYGRNLKDQYVEFDVTDTVSEWIKGIPNNGFSIQSDDPTSMSFRSRETNKPPVLYIEYFSSEPLNASRSQMKFEIAPQLEDQSRMPFEVEIISFFKYSPMPFSIFAHDPNHLYDSQMGFDIVASRDKLGFDLVVKYERSDTMNFEISVSETKIDGMPFEIFVPIFDGQTVLPFEITPQLKGQDKIEFIIESLRDYKTKTIDLPFEIFVQGKYKVVTTELGFDITIERPTKEKQSNMEFIIDPQVSKDTKMEFEVTADTERTRVYGVQPFEISVQEEKTDNMSFSINVTRDKMGFMLGVFNFGTVNMPFEISAKKLTITRLGFDIEVGIPPDTKQTSFIYII